MNYPVLWHFPSSHFNEKVRWALDYKAIPHRRRALFLEYLPLAMWKTGQPNLPILFQDGRAIVDSTNIIELLERLRPDPPLYPSDDRLRNEVLGFEDYLDESLGPAVRGVLIAPLLDAYPRLAVAALGLGQKPGTLRMARMGFPFMRTMYRKLHRITPQTVDEGREIISTALARIEEQLQAGGYLFGNAFSVADLTAASLLYPLALPEEYPYSLPQEVEEHVRQNFEDFSNHTVVDWVREIYHRHRGSSAEVAA